MTNNFTHQLDSLEHKHNLQDLMKGYFKGQRSRLIDNYKILKKYLNKKERILDVGSYPSYNLATLKRLGYNIQGVDIDPSREFDFLHEEHLNVKQCNIETDTFPFNDNSFDKVILSEVFEHLYINPIFTMNEIKRILKQEGQLIITTPNSYSIKRIYNFILGRGTFDSPFDEFNKINTVGHRGHIREYSFNDIKDFLTKIGFKKIEMYYLSINHVGIENKRFTKFIIKMIYKLIPPVRNNMLIIAQT